MQKNYQKNTVKPLRNSQEKMEMLLCLWMEAQVGQKDLPEELHLLRLQRRLQKELNPTNYTTLQALETMVTNLVVCLIAHPTQ